MRHVGGDTGATLDVVQGELSDTGVELEEEGQRLANPTAGTEDGDLGGLHSFQTVLSAIASWGASLGEQRGSCSRWRR